MTKRSGRGIIVLLIVLMMSAGGVYAEKNIAGSMRDGEGDPKAGKEKAEMCGGCHGADGMSIDPAFPHLAGQYAGYTYKQVLDFQSGNRSADETMVAMAGMVTDVQDLKDISAYYASLKMMKGTPGDAELAKKGEKLNLYGNKKLGDFAACVRCHGEQGKGLDKKNALFPVIGGQSKDYLIKQLRDFKSGVRTNDPAGMMAVVAQGMTDEEIIAVSEYLSGL
ncbi:MAG TPA: cytochrome c4 [Gammaproteobacteria bacterium]|nr:cytochrome c4 [Gammaproteobacteria bacterium]